VREDHRLDPSHGLPAAAVAVADREHPGRGERPLDGAEHAQVRPRAPDDVPARGGVRHVVRGVGFRVGLVLRDRPAHPHAGRERLGPRAVARAERVPDLAARGVRVDGERAPRRQRRERDGHGDGLPGREVHGGQGRARVEHVAAARARLRPDGQPGLLQRGDVALDRALAHLERGGEAGAGRAGPAGAAQLLGDRVETFGPVHDPSLDPSRQW